MTEKEVAAGPALPPLGSGPHRRRLGVISLVACLGGLLFGYDTGVSNGAARFMQADLQLTNIELGIAISSLIFAAAVGACTAGRLADVWGRRTTMVLLSVLFFVGALVVVFTPGFEILVAGRILLGLAVGGACTVVPVYLAELAPFEIRGAITGRNELAVVIGQLIAFVMNAIIGTTFGHVDGVWRIMFSICALPALALFVGMLRMPESPRWLVEKGRRDEALEILEQIRPKDRAVAELREVERVAAETERKTGVSIRAILTDKWLIRVLLVGIGVAIVQRYSGINAVMYYGHEVLIDAGFASDTALVANIAVGIFSVVGGLIAVYNMDRIDRRTTFLVGLSLTTVCHVLIAGASVLLPAGNTLRPYVLLFLVVTFVFAMQTFLNVAVWVWLAEIFPLHMRGLGIGIAQFVGLLADGVLVLFFPSLVAKVGITGSFFLFALVGVVALLFVFTQVPETRGVTLEKLERDVTTGAIYRFRKRPTVRPVSSGDDTRVGSP